MKTIVLLITSIALSGCAQKALAPSPVLEPTPKTVSLTVAQQSLVEDTVDTAGPRIRVKVTGAVQNPGMFLLPVDATVGDAVAAASGLTPRGSWMKFGSGLIRKGSSDRERFYERTPARIEDVKEIRLRDGDTVFIGSEAL